MPELTVLQQLPDGFLETRVLEIHRLLSGPTLIHLPGRHEEPLFVTILLHGNEDVGLTAIQHVLKLHAGRALPRALSIFVGNIDAARMGLRRLPDQVDFNRVWPGTDHPTCPESELMARIVDEMSRLRPFASIDLHNNTGHNPHYACVTKMNHRHLQLASLFSPTVVYFERPLGVQTAAFAPFCPAITCECGKVGNERGAVHAAELVNACLHMAEIPDRPVPKGDQHIFHTVATIKVPESVSFGFGNLDRELRFREDLDMLNFAELPAGTVLGARRHGSTARLVVEDESGEDISARVLTIDAASIRFREPTVPSMFTCDEHIVRQDCLGYIMERLELPA